MHQFRSGQYENQGFYKAFVPAAIDRGWEIADMEVLKLLSVADRQLGRLDMYSEYVNIEMYISMHIAKEATQSSRIEGTQTKMEEAFMKKEDVAESKRDDWEEVQNYIRAMNEAVGQLDRLPFSARLIRSIHKVLIDGVRGENKMPGEFRRSQNWIGGATLDDAVFVPPVHTLVPELMSDLEKFANNELNPLPDLLKIAVIHYQFETIHPFLDGNGRVGRLLIPLYLVSKTIIKRPILYLSDFFERNRTLYYDNLMRVRTHHDLNQWFKFFLSGVIETSKKGISTFDGILQLQKSLEERIRRLGSGRVATDARKIIEHLYQTPVTEVTAVSRVIGKSNVSAYKLIANLEKIGILEEITGGARGRIYIFREYMDLFYRN